MADQQVKVTAVATMQAQRYVDSQVQTLQQQINALQYDRRKAEAHKATVHVVILGIGVMVAMVCSPYVAPIVLALITGVPAIVVEVSTKPRHRR